MGKRNVELDPAPCELTPRRAIDCRWAYHATMRTTVSTLLTLPALALAGCDRESGGAAESELSISADSAGVGVVESVRPAWADRPGWTVSQEPELSIGGRNPTVTASGDTVLFGSIGSVNVLQSGRVAVADRQIAVVSVFDAGGEPVHRFGGRGEGPGELRGIWDLRGTHGRIGRRKRPRVPDRRRGRGGGGVLRTEGPHLRASRQRMGISSSGVAGNVS